MSARYCAVEEASRRLAAVGFQKLSEKQEWKLKPGGRYYFTRNLSTIVAFAVGAKYQPGNGLHMIGAHTDRYNLPCTCRAIWLMLHMLFSKKYPHLN